MQSPPRLDLSLGESRANCETSGFRGRRRGQGRTSEFWFSLYQGEEAYLIFMRLTVSATSPKQRISLTQIRKQKTKRISTIRALVLVSGFVLAISPLKSNAAQDKPIVIYMQMGGDRGI